MAKRTEYAATMIRRDGTVTTATAYAWNSALKAAEGLVREHAKASAESYQRGYSTIVDNSTGETVRPAAPGALYSCAWQGTISGEVVVVTVEATS